MIRHLQEENERVEPRVSNLTFKKQTVHGGGKREREHVLMDMDNSVVIVGGWKEGGGEEGLGVINDDGWRLHLGW